MAEAIIYGDMNYQGPSQTLAIGSYDSSSLKVGNDQVSSVKVPVGLKVTLFENAGFSGNKRTFITDANWVGNNFNDKASSIVVENSGFPLIDESSQAGDNFKFDLFNNNLSFEPWLYTTVNNWMSYLPDSTPIKAISMPGTHDTCARFGGIAFQAQSIPLDKQLEGGIRCIDIRTRSLANGKLAIHHTTAYQNIMMDEVLNIVKDFLAAQPKETIVMQVNYDELSPESNSRPFLEIWNDYMKTYGDLFAKNVSSGSTLGTLRGKVFLLASFTEPEQRGIANGDSCFDRQNAWEVLFLAEDWVKGNQASLPGKRRIAKEYLEKAVTTDQWVFNFLSGSTYMAPCDVARDLNGAAYNYLGPNWGKRKLGIVSMDFPGEKLIYRIIKSNFAGQKKVPAKAFRCQSDHSWVEFRLPEGTEGQVIEIPGGAYNHYVFPKCNRVRWSNLGFLCTASGWQLTRGNWDADGLCDGSPGNSPYVAVGDR